MYIYACVSVCVYSCVSIHLLICMYVCVLVGCCMHQKSFSFFTKNYPPPTN